MLAALLLNPLVEVTAATGGGYTPYSVYDPGFESVLAERYDKKQEAQIEARRQDLRLEREQLRADIRALVTEEPIQQRPTVSPLKVRPAERSKDRVTLNATVLRTASLSIRRSRLEVVQNELLFLEEDLESLVRRQDKDEDLLTILVLVN